MVDGLSCIFLFYCVEVLFCARRLRALIAGSVMTEGGADLSAEFTLLDLPLHFAHKIPHRITVWLFKCYGRQDACSANARISAFMWSHYCMTSVTLGHSG